MKLVHPKAAHAAEARRPQGHFSRLAGTVLLASLCAAPMVFPKHAAAQEAEPAAGSINAAAPTDTMSTAYLQQLLDSLPLTGAEREGRRADTASGSAESHARDSALAVARADSARHADSASFTSPRLSFFRIIYWAGYSGNPVKEVRGVPASMRAVGRDTVSGAANSFPPDIGIGLDPSFDLGPAITFSNGLGAKLSAGIEMATCFPHKVSDGQAWYAVYPTAPGIFLWYFKPYAVAELKAGIRNIGFVGLGYRVAEDGYSIYNGSKTLKNGMETDYSGAWGCYDYNIDKDFKLIDMTVGMPYVFFSSPAIPTEDSKNLQISVFFGFKHVLRKSVGDLGGGSLVFRSFPFVVGATYDFHVWKHD